MKIEFEYLSKDQYRIIEKETFEGKKYYFLQYASFKYDFYKFSLFYLKNKLHHSIINWYYVYKIRDMEPSSFHDFKTEATIDYPTLKKVDVDLNAIINHACTSKDETISLMNKYIEALNSYRNEIKERNEKEAIDIEESKKNKLIPEKETIIEIK